MGFLRPLPRSPSCEVALTFRFCASVCSGQGTDLVPPSRFLTVLMGCSAESFAGLLHPAADPGVRRVSGFLLRSLAGSSESAVPTGASTLRSFSLAKSCLPFFPPGRACPLVVARGLCRSGDLRFRGGPGDLAISRFSPSVAGVGFVRLQGFEPSVESVATSDVSAWTRSLLPWVSASVRRLDSPGWPRVLLLLVSRRGFTGLAVMVSSASRNFRVAGASTAGLDSREVALSGDDPP
jgi:hypothetical protein